MNVVIIGNSAAGLNALETFRKYDQESKVTVISKEGGLPYSRVLLPYFLRGKLEHDTMYIRDKNYFAEFNADYVEGEVEQVDTEEKYVLVNATKIAYDKLLIATGASAVKPPVEGIQQEGIYHMWTMNDADALTNYYKKGNRALILGSGFVSLQAAWAALVRGMEVTIIELADRIMPRVLDEKGASILTEKIKGFGADLRVGTLTEKIVKNEDGTFTIHTKGQDTFDVDVIIVGTGVRSNIQFLNESGIELDRGVLVDEYMSTNIENVYAAGDVAQGPTAFGEKHMIHALWPTAVEMGKIAGANMAGKKLVYTGSLNMNVTQMFDITVASMGKFADDEGDKVYVSETEKGYLKVVYENGLIVGATVVGSSDMVPLLGKLRPLIRKKQVIDCQPERLQDYLQLTLARSIFKSI